MGNKLTISMDYKKIPLPLPPPSSKFGRYCNTIHNKLRFQLHIATYAIHPSVNHKTTPSLNN